MIKKSLVSELPGPSAQTFKLANVNDGDSLGWAVLTDGAKEILLATAQGMTIRFSEEEVRPMGLAAAGVNGDQTGRRGCGGWHSNPAGGRRDLPDRLGRKGQAGRAERLSGPGTLRKGRDRLGTAARVSLAGLAAGKKNDIVTLHLAKAAPKMTRLDAAPLRKRSAVRGDAVVEVKAGDAVLGITEAWAVERFVVLGKKEEVRKKKRDTSRKVAAKKK